MNTVIKQENSIEDILHHFQKRALSEKIDFNALKHGERERIFLFSTLVDAFAREANKNEVTIEIKHTARS